ncbi:MAG: ribosome biogenesis GTPase Der [Planctomycetota bacterium]|nr:ribosome biogenesis GTPase Der [Planctomycetota bacterium]
MPVSRVAIVGRPNVGKSSLMNMLAGAKVSIVDPTPGVTRDRVTSLIELEGPDPTDPVKLVELTDTGGYGVYTADGQRFDDAGEDLSRLTAAIEGQIAAAVERSDLILFAVDAQSGITALDQTIARLLRERTRPTEGRTPAPVIVVANKVDAMSWEGHAFDAASLGFGEPLLVSAKTNYRRRDFREKLYALVPEATRDEQARVYPEMRIALVGRRNAGKSSFVNALAGEERCIVSEIAGTTRDSIDVRFQMEGRTLVAIDTAGVRRRSKFADAVEHWAFHRSLLAIARADVVLLLLDATQEISGVDKRLGARVLAEHKPCAIVVTKWDLVQGKKNRKGAVVSPEDYAEYIAQELKGMSICPIVFTSSVETFGLREAVDVAFDLFSQARQRVPTAQLNETIRAILQERNPASKSGQRAKILYVSQVGVLPPTIVMVVNHPELFTGPYQRFLLNRLHEELPFAEIPIRLIIRERQRVELGALKSRRGPASAAEGDDEGRLVPAFDPVQRRAGARRSAPTGEEALEIDFTEEDQFDEDALIIDDDTDDADEDILEIDGDDDHTDDDGDDAEDDDAGRRRGSST